MNKRILLQLCAVISFFNITSMAFAADRPDLRYCGTSSRTGAALYQGTGPLNEIQSCIPDNNTQALLVERSGTVVGNGPAWLNYLNQGGIIITEFRSSHDVYNEIYGTAYPDTAQSGPCQDNVMPSLKINPSHPFWQENNGLTETPVGQEGCGLDLINIVNGETEVTALGGRAGTAVITFAYRQQGAGALWLLDQDWQDSGTVYTNDQLDFMGALINTRAFGAVAVPTLSTYGLLLLTLGLMFFARRRFTA